MCRPMFLMPGSKALGSSIIPSGHPMTRSRRYKPPKTNMRRIGKGVLAKLAYLDTSRQGSAKSKN